MLSHFHTDHAGGIATFFTSEFIAAEVDYELASGFGGKLRGCLPQHWPKWCAPRPIEHDDRRFGPFRNSTTLTAANDVDLLPAPGHTVGHLSVAVEDGDDVIALAADASYTEDYMLDGVGADLQAAAPSLAAMREPAAQRPISICAPTIPPRSSAAPRGNTSGARAG